MGFSVPPCYSCTRSFLHSEEEFLCSGYKCHPDDPRSKQDQQLCKLPAMPVPDRTRHAQYSNTCTQEEEKGSSTAPRQLNTQPMGFKEAELHPTAQEMKAWLRAPGSALPPKLTQVSCRV